MRGFARRPLGDILISMGLITSEQLEDALQTQQVKHKRLGELLVESGIVDEEQITQACAIQMDVGYVNLDDVHIPSEAIAVISESVAREYTLIPVAIDSDRLSVAMANPLDVEVIDMLRFDLKMRIEPLLATEWKIIEAINRYYGGEGSHELESFVLKATTDLDIGADEYNEDLNMDIDQVKRASDQAPIVKMVNIIITQAVRKKASDIHIEPARGSVNVRYRIDGELHLVRSIPRKLHPPITSRVKIMADLDISERRLPQDGRISARIDGRSIDLRVSTSPTIFGERIVMRILDRTKGLIPIDQLGFSPRGLTIFRKLISQPYGIILVTGPTGSGKTTTLYASLNALRSETTNIMTVEDPVEYELDGISQTNINPRIGLTFARQLRSILRQDPDIILVGEIRDTETADVAFRAALTGHLVLSTLHCNDAPSAITRLLDMDVEPFLVASAINGVLAQRLVRILCPDCREAYETDDTINELLGLPPGSRETIYRAVGCPSCDSTGYRGRTAIREIMPINDKVRRLALSKANSSEIREAAVKSGMDTMRMDGAKKVLEGITTVEELERKIFVEIDNE